MRGGKFSALVMVRLRSQAVKQAQMEAMREQVRASPVAVALRTPRTRPMCQQRSGRGLCAAVSVF